VRLVASGSVPAVCGALWPRCCAAQLDETSRAAAVDRQRLQRLNKELELATQSEADAKVSRLLAEAIAPNRRPLYAEVTIGRAGRVDLHVLSSLPCDQLHDDVRRHNCAFCRQRLLGTSMI
jgi:hypothetical protein